MKKNLKNQIKKAIKSSGYSPEVTREFIQRLKQGYLTRDENPITHFSTFFAAYDPKEKMVFIGHHKKSDLWLFNGGHIDKGETLDQTIEREIWEEWGIVMKADRIGGPHLLTLTDIDNNRQLCKKHYDVWYFIEVDKNIFRVDQQLIDTEFYELSWKSVKESKKLQPPLPC